MYNVAFLTKFFKTLNPSEPHHTKIKPGKYCEVKVNRESAKPLNLVVDPLNLYKFRDKLYSSFENFVQETEKSNLSKTCDEIEDWLYGDGEDLPKSEFSNF